jgi:hypothetical protein
LLLVNVTVTPPAGAGLPKLRARFSELPDVTATLAGNRMAAAEVACGVTVTLAVVLIRFGALAVMITDPPAIPITGTDALVAPVAKLTIGGTVATVASLEFRLTARPAGAGADKFNVRFCVAPWERVRLPGQKLIVVAAPPDVTCT